MGDVNGEVTEPDADHPTAGTQLYVKIDGWYISGVQEQTYLSKQFGDWTSATSLNDVNGWKWNVPTFHRSFWGQSVGYGKQTEGGLRFFTFDNPNNKTVGQGGILQREHIDKGKPLYRNSGPSQPASCHIRLSEGHCCGQGQEGPEPR